MSKTWGKIGAWAADAEQAEAEERDRAATEAKGFPSLKEATVAKPKKKKMSLSEFATGIHVGPGAGAGARRDLSMESRGLTTDEILRLPTGPKERSAEEMDYGRLGGGFRSYDRTGPPTGRRERGDDNDGSWGGGRRSNGGFDDERRTPSSRSVDFDQPSRADEVENWATEKKSLPPASMDSGRHDRYSGSRADEVGNWAVGKNPLPGRSTVFVSGFRDSAPDSDRWSRGGSRDTDRERPRLVLDPPRALNEPVTVRATRASPFGAARPREEVLAEKGLDWKKLDSEIETRKTSRPTSSHSSRPSSSQSRQPDSPASQVLEGVEQKARPKVNPFGDAKPREVLLQQQGKDWRNIDLELEHRGVDRPETEQEKMMKEELYHLKKELEKETAVNANGESLQGSGEEKISLHEQILHKERDLELLIHKLDDKVRFGQKTIGRPGSGAGKVSGFHERPPSQSDVPEDSSSIEFMDRPRSHGRGDVGTRPRDDKRAFQSSRERGFLGNRDIDRSNSRERW
ncbi:hypothetical protein HHK36_007475 [Tetracentron sinense]|uniref:Uncharacterized protein n=1 Tax=Tetracentron sinense TaxID=13715 RepID=A0A834ZJV2_TETSI|nr:hypothetical protein HHK36_007475 [Tetracentron sinense]